MDGADLSTEQLRKLHEQVMRHWRYLASVTERMRQRGFPRTDPLYQRFEAAEKAAHALMIHLMYAAMGEPSKTAPTGAVPNCPLPAPQTAGQDASEPLRP